LSFLKKKTDKALFSQWITHYHSKLYRHALWMTGNQDSAMEMVQETYYQAWLVMHQLKDKNKALPWLLTILRRLVYREQRCQYRDVETINQLSLLDNQADSPNNDQLLDIYKALDHLSATQRETLLLHALHGFSYQEISEQLNVPIGTVMSRIARARETLRKLQKSEPSKIIQFNDFK